MKKIIMMLWMAAASAVAEHLYIADSALGTGDGASAANAKAAYTFFNTAANWDTLVSTTNGKIGPGDTVHIVGVINAPAGTLQTVEGGQQANADAANQLFFQGSGTSGNPITLKFDVGGQIRHPTGLAQGLIAAISGVHDIVIQGANNTVAMNTGAFVQKDIDIFANGTNQANQLVNSYGINITSGASNLTIRDLYIYGPYVREHNHPSDQHASGNASTLKGLNNLVYDNCRADYSEGGLGMTGGGNPSTGLRITNNYIYGCSTGIKLGTVTGGMNDGSVVTGNVMDGFSAWAGINTVLLPDGQFHCDGFQTFTAGANQKQRNTTVAYNVIGPDLGIYGSMNAHIFMEDDVCGDFIYNNLLLANSTPINTYGTPVTNPNYGRAPGTANGFITAGGNGGHHTDPTAVKSLIANNTILGAGSGQGINTGFSVVVGNIISNTSTMISVYENQADNVLHGDYFFSDQNVFWMTSGFYTWGVSSGPGAGSYNNNFPLWKSNMGCDLNTVQANPLASFPDGALSAGSPAIGQAPTQVLFDDDLDGNLRTGEWDAGALEATEGVASGTAQTINAVNVTVGQ